MGGRKKHALCETALDVCDIRDIPGRAEGVPAIERDPPPGHCISVVAGRVVVQLANEQRWMSLDDGCLDIVGRAYGSYIDCEYYACAV